MLQQVGWTDNQSSYRPAIGRAVAVQRLLRGGLRVDREQRPVEAAHVVDMTLHSNVPQLMSTEHLAEYLRIPVRTLEDWRSPGRHTGPKWIRMGKRVR